MDSSTVILIVALVLSIVAGPAIGFALARRRLAARDRMRADRSARFADLDDSLRNLSSTGSPPSEPTGRPPVASNPGRQSPSPSELHGAPPPVQPGAARPPSAGGAHPLASRRFDFEPPVFGEASTPRTSTERFTRDPDAGSFGPAPVPGSVASADPGPDHPSDRPGEPAPTGTPDETAPTGTPGETVPTAARREPVPTAAGTEVVPAHESPKFLPIADIVERAVADRLSWLDRLSSGRLLMLHQLGYDDPVKIANLRPAEISRLARTLQLTEDEILTEWIPAARKELGMRLATTESTNPPGSTTRA